MVDNSQNKIRLIPFAEASGSFNMAADAYLLSLPETVLRFYAWEHPVISFGKNNVKLDEIDGQYCSEQSIELVKRPSGGKTVFHHQEITYALAGNCADFSSSILETYRLISQPLVLSLKKLGLKVELNQEKKISKDNSICFKDFSPFEILINNKKIIGSAQLRRKNRFLQHGSILLKIDWQIWRKIWKISSESQELEDHITSLDQEVKDLPSIKSLVTLFIDEFQAALNKEIYLEPFSPKEIEKINNDRPTCGVFRR